MGSVPRALPSGPNQPNMLSQGSFKVDQRTSEKIDQKRKKEESGKSRVLAVLHPRIHTHYNQISRRPRLSIFRALSYSVIRLVYGRLFFIRAFRVNRSRCYMLIRI